MSSCVAIEYKRGSLRLLNQLKLPHETEWIDVHSAEDGWRAIREMVVRGAPAIAIAAALSLAVELHHRLAQFADVPSLETFLVERLAYLKTSRPTAVNLFEAADRLAALVQREASTGPDATVTSVADTFFREAEAMLARDVADNKAIGAHGADAIVARCGRRPLRILTHCNTGSLATGGWGTALGIVRTLHERGLLECVYADETRPYLQGARLTAYEMAAERIPCVLLCDGAAAAAMRRLRIDAVVVGADRVVANGDTANKIGTYHLAIACAHHGVPFFVAAPRTSIDPRLACGDDVVIEERDPREVTHVAGTPVAAPGVRVWNPSFDVTPAALITGIVTERGLVPRRTDSDAFDVAGFLQRTAPSA